MKILLVFAATTEIFAQAGTMPLGIDDWLQAGATGVLCLVIWRLLSALETNQKTILDHIKTHSATDTCDVGNQIRALQNTIEHAKGDTDA
jgi:hypothetical protein